MFDESLTFEEWRNRARSLLIAGVKPDIALSAIAGDAAPTVPPGGPTRQLTLPAALMRLLESVSCYRAAGRYQLMYRLAWRTLFEQPKLLEDPADPDVRRASLMNSAVRRDVHKMHAFVRFREIRNDDGEATFFAWFEPEHEILRRGAPFFADRFPNMKWTIATPDGSAVWDGTALNFFTSPQAEARPSPDTHEHLWRTYYRSICNVARINLPAMQREMPKKYWRNLPEAADIRKLIMDADKGVIERHDRSEKRANALGEAMEKALSEVPPAGDGPQECRRCELWQRATQAVLGKGPKGAFIMLVGEQPGDAEDLRGEPFVGPAGRLLDEAIAEAGLDRSRLYVTNAVKHFKWEPRGKRRLHKRPDLREVRACSIWLDREIADIKPVILVALGATALRALVDAALSIEAARQQALSHATGAAIVATYHPSAILRAEGERAAYLRGELIADLRSAGQRMRQ